MILNQRKAVAAIAAIAMLTFMAFQNCAPAKLSGESSDAPSTGIVSTVGTKVNLATLMAAPSESSSNLLYPLTTAPRESRYSLGKPVMENVILKNNDFNRIEWIHANTSTVISNTENLQLQTYSPEFEGPIMVFGYRGSAPAFLGEVRLSPLGSTTLNANSVGAINVIQKSVATDLINETYVVTIEAPNVDVLEIQYLLQPSGEIIQNQRAFSMTKKRTESVTATITVTDATNQKFTRQLSFPASVATTPTTTLPTSTTQPPVALPDLLVTAITWTPALPADGKPVRFYVTVKNIGTGATPAGVLLGVLFRVDGTAVSWSGTYSNSIPPGQSVTLQASDGPSGSADWSAVIGNHSVTAQVDDVGRIAESNETNNMLNSTIVVAAVPVVHLRTRVNNISHVDAYSNMNGIMMQIWSPYTSVTQNFQLTSASELRVQGKCLVAASATSGSAITLADCDGATNQKWNYNSATGEIKSTNGLCVDLAGSSVTNGNRVNVFNCHGGLNQKWDLVP